MSKSIKEQLLAAGLVTQKKATQVEQDKRKQARQQPTPPKGRAPAPSPARQEVRQAQNDKATRDRELNRQRQMERERRAIITQLEQIIEVQRLDRSAGEVPYRFVVKDKVKKIYVTAEQHAGIVRGTLSVVRFRDGFALVTRETAERVAARDARTVLVMRNGDEPDVADDPEYAEFKVPDDLMW